MECKSAKEDCQQETGLEVEDKKILIFSPKPQRYPGIDSVCICKYSNKKNLRLNKKNNTFKIYIFNFVFLVSWMLIK